MAFLTSQLVPGLVVPWKRELHRIAKLIAGGRYGSGFLLERLSDKKRARICFETERYGEFIRELTDAYIAGLTHCQRRRIWGEYDGPDCRWCRAGLDGATRVGDLNTLILLPDQYVSPPAFDPARNRPLTDQEVKELLS